MAEAAEGAEKPKSNIGEKIKKILPVVLIALNLGVSGTGLYFAFLATVGWQYPALTEEEEAKNLGIAREKRDNTPILFTLDKFTVNLDGSPKRVIQTEVSLEMLDEKGFEEVVTLGAQARDAIVKILNEKKYADIETIQGKLFLKDQITTTINHLLKNGVVKGVYFSHFVIQ